MFLCYDFYRLYLETDPQNTDCKAWEYYLSALHIQARRRIIIYLIIIISVQESVPS